MFGSPEALQSKNKLEEIMDSEKLTGWERLVFFNALSKDNWQRLSSAQVIFMAGLQGTGKTWLALRLSRLLGSAYLSTDKSRMRLYPDEAGYTRESRYTLERKEAVYRALREEMRQRLSFGEKVIIEGTYLEPEKRRKAFGLAREVIGDNFVVVNVYSSEKTILERIKRKVKTGPEPGDYSEVWLVGERVYWHYKEKMLRGEFSYPDEKEGITVIRFKNDLERIKRNFGKLEVIGWDVDQTLYPDNPRLKAAVQEEIYKRIEETKQISREEAMALFEAAYEELGSATKTLIELGVGKETVMQECLDAVDKSQFLGQDERLIEIFKNLEDFRHIIISNTRRDICLRTLKILGLDPGIFEKILTIDETGAIKPDLKPFQMMVEYTGLVAEQHLYLGDREKTDIMPANSLGMRTAMVWGKSEMADVSLPEVYDILEIVQ